MIVSSQIQDTYAATSLFMLEPCVYAFNNKNFVFATLLASTCVISILHWSNFSHGSVLHLLDRYFSIATLTCAWAQNPNYVQTAFPLIVLFWGGRRHYYQGRMYNAARWHLAFRYVAFWLCHIHADAFPNYLTLVFFTVAYALCVKDVVLEDSE